LKVSENKKEGGRKRMVTERRFRALERRVEALEAARESASRKKAPGNESKALDILTISHQIPLYARDVYTHWGEVSGEDLEKLNLYLEIIIEHFSLALPENLS